MASNSRLNASHVNLGEKENQQRLLDDVLPQGGEYIPIVEIYAPPIENQSSLANNVDNENGVLVTCSVNQQAVNRDSWGGKLEFLLTCIGCAVGLGNVWRFPFLCFKNGGGAFLIPYFVMLATLGLPLFFLELAFGQFASLGPISIWTISPLFKGVGYGMVIISAIVGVYYNVIVSHCIFFFFASFAKDLPWSSFNSTTSSNNTNKKTVASTEQYYENYVLRKSNGIEDFGWPVWHLSLCLLLAWIIVAVVLIKGIKILGKVSYFTALFPYVILTILLIFGAMQPGSYQGVIFYLSPDFSRLTDPFVWSEAATQIFFSLSCCNGGLITMSSYNKFRNNCCRDAIIVALVNCGTSIYAGFVIFCQLGIMAKVKDVPIEHVAKEGPGLVFVVYPDALSNTPFIPTFWSICFFLMMVTLGFGSAFSIVETVLSGFQDEFQKDGYFNSKKQIILFRCIVCAVMFLLGLTMVTPGGTYLLHVVDTTMTGFPMLFLALFEIVILCYFYGIRQFLKDVKMMTGKTPNWYWRITWCVISPLILVVLIISQFIVGSKDWKYGDYVYPHEVKYLSWAIASFPLSFIPIILCYRYCREGGYMLFCEFLKPKYKWGPAEPTHRYPWLQRIRSVENLKRDAQESSQDVVEEEKFFQSKLNVAQKLSSAASRESGMNQLIASQGNLSLKVFPPGLVEGAASLH